MQWLDIYYGCKREWQDSWFDQDRICFYILLKKNKKETKKISITLWLRFQSDGFS